MIARRLEAAERALAIAEAIQIAGDRIIRNPASQRVTQVTRSPSQFRDLRVQLLIGQLWQRRGLRRLLTRLAESTVKKRVARHGGDPLVLAFQSLLGLLGFPNARLIARASGDGLDRPFGSGGRDRRARCRRAQPSPKRLA